ncbi:tryptophan halogenase family protein [Parvularcula lutaonensis]|uniref:Tryptophan halogenase family protein n=1 Tax=Parvularcula lutaonensis TaxID=491923 RepID=A0ABV7MDZ5_9PROT|nr:tryptophan halogenase family protein [Parvularcula lutaonensis]GGY48744.1 tryptophan halogenase [Parvularcula lutaonensis]
MNERIRSVVIVGGGTAGWMTAAALARYLPRETTSITLVESEEIGTVGVGEATIPQIATFNRMLGIDEDAFLRETQATFKLGIEFRDWGRLGERYLHPFGTYGWDLQGTEFHHFWMRARRTGESNSLDDYCLNSAAAYAGKFARPDGNPRSPLSRLAYAFHFDALLYAKFLRVFAEARGVNRVEGRVGSVEQEGDTGFVRRLGLEDGRSIEGELFIDCTGFVGLLIEKALAAGYDDWTELLPMDRAVAMPCARIEEPKPYTIATARGAGWTWRIPLRHRTGNGHVYASRYTDKEAATQILMDALDGEPLAEPRHLSFTTGIRRKFWDRNVVAIGLSGGFLEPLESTSIHMIQTAIAKLLALFPDTSWSAVDRDEYNRLLTTTFTHIRDFIVLHYVATSRDDTPFWRDRKKVEIPETLARKMALIEGAGRFFRYEDELFSVTSWLAVMGGQGRGPSAYNPIADGISDTNLKASLADMRSVIMRTVNAMPRHEEFLSRVTR